MSLDLFLNSNFDPFDKETEGDVYPHSSLGEGDGIIDTEVKKFKYLERWNFKQSQESLIDSITPTIFDSIQIARMKEDANEEQRIINDIHLSDDDVNSLILNNTNNNNIDNKGDFYEALRENLSRKYGEEFKTIDKTHLKNIVIKQYIDDSMEAERVTGQFGKLGQFVLDFFPSVIHGLTDPIELAILGGTVLTGGVGGFVARAGVSVGSSVAKSLGVKYAAPIVASSIGYGAFDALVNQLIQKKTKVAVGLKPDSNKDVFIEGLSSSLILSTLFEAGIPLVAKPAIRLMSDYVTGIVRNNAKRFKNTTHVSDADLLEEYEKQPDFDAGSFNIEQGKPIGFNADPNVKEENRIIFNDLGNTLASTTIHEDLNPYLSKKVEGFVTKFNNKERFVFNEATRVSVSDKKLYGEFLSHLKTATSKEDYIKKLTTMFIDEEGKIKKIDYKDTGLNSGEAEDHRKKTESISNIIAELTNSFEIEEKDGRLRFTHGEKDKESVSIGVATEQSEKKGEQSQEELNRRKKAIDLEVIKNNAIKYGHDENKKLTVNSYITAMTNKLNTYTSIRDALKGEFLTRINKELNRIGVNELIKAYNGEGTTQRASKVIGIIQELKEFRRKTAYDYGIEYGKIDNHIPQKWASDAVVSRGVEEFVEDFLPELDIIKTKESYDFATNEELTKQTKGIISDVNKFLEKTKSRKAKYEERITGTTKQKEKDLKNLENETSKNISNILRNADNSIRELERNSLQLKKLENKLHTKESDLKVKALTRELNETINKYKRIKEERETIETNNMEAEKISNVIHKLKANLEIIEDYTTFKDITNVIDLSNKVKDSNEKIEQHKNDISLKLKEYESEHDVIQTIEEIEEAYYVLHKKGIIDDKENFSEYDKGDSVHLLDVMIKSILKVDEKKLLEIYEDQSNIETYKVEAEKERIIDEVETLNKNQEDYEEKREEYIKRIDEVLSNGKRSDREKIIIKNKMDYILFNRRAKGLDKTKTKSMQEVFDLEDLRERALKHQLTTNEFESIMTMNRDLYNELYRIEKVKKIRIANKKISENIYKHNEEIKKFETKKSNIINKMKEKLRRKINTKNKSINFVLKRFNKKKLTKIKNEMEQAIGKAIKKSNELSKQKEISNNNEWIRDSYRDINLKHDERLTMDNMSSRFELEIQELNKKHNKNNAELNLRLKRQKDKLTNTIDRQMERRERMRESIVKSFNKIKESSESSKSKIENRNVTKDIASKFEYMKKLAEELGRPFGREQLEQIRYNIAYGDESDVLSMAMSGTGASVSGGKRRILHFKNFEGFEKLNKKYGAIIDLRNLVKQDIEGNIKDIARLKTLEASADFVKETFDSDIKKIMKSNGKEFLNNVESARSKVLNYNLDYITSSRKKERRGMWSSSAKMYVALRRLNALGGAGLTSLTDDAQQVAFIGSELGWGYFKTLKGYFKGLTEVKMEADEASRLLVNIESMQAFFEDEETNTYKSKYSEKLSKYSDNVSDFTFKYNGMTYVTDRGTMFFNKQFLIDLPSISNNERFKSTLKDYGINDTDITRIEGLSVDMDGVPVFTDSFKQTKTYNKLMNALYNVRRKAISQSSQSMRATMMSAAGGLGLPLVALDSIFFLKKIPLQVWFDHTLSPIIRGEYSKAASYFIQNSIFTAIRISLKYLAMGYKPDYNDPNFYAEVIRASSAMPPILSDFLKMKSIGGYQASEAVGKLALGKASSIVDGVGLFLATLTGDKEYANKRIISLAKSFAPYKNHPLVSRAYERSIFDNMQLSLNPNAYNYFARREKGRMESGLIRIED